MAKLRVTCPACRHTLGVERGVSEPWLTCPHCLTQVMNPWQQVTATPAPAPPGPPRCPECGRDVEANWRFCPHCNADLRGSKHVRPAGAEVDVEVKRDAVGSVSGLSLLAVIVMVGFLVFLFFLCGGGPNRYGFFLESPEGLVFLLLILFVVIAAGVVGLTSGSRSALKVGLSVVVLVICGAIACVLFLAFLCTQMLRAHGGHF